MDKDKNKNLVSVITPYLNAEAFLEEAINSVLDQSYSLIEHILVNDGSTDKSLKIAEHYARLHPDRIRLVNNNGNRGTASARNLGIQSSRGRYIGFLDADDVYMPEKVSHQIASLETHPECDVALGRTMYWYTWRKGFAGKDHTPDYRMRSNHTYKPGDLMLLILSSDRASPCICSFLIKREEAIRIGMFGEDIQLLYEDQVFITKMLVNCSVRLTHGVLEKYRQRQDSTWHESLADGSDKAALIKFRQWQSHYLLRLSLKQRIELKLKQKLGNVRNRIFRGTKITGGR